MLLLPLTQEPPVGRSEVSDHSPGPRSLGGHPSPRGPGSTAEQSMSCTAGDSTWNVLLALEQWSSPSL